MEVSPNGHADMASSHAVFDVVIVGGGSAGIATAASLSKRTLTLKLAIMLASQEGGRALLSACDGYGACPLTVERGRIVLAEFGYGGKLLPTLPTWLIDGTRPSRAAWFLKARMLPPIYWRGMLKGHEWLAAPTMGTPVEAGPKA